MADQLNPHRSLRVAVVGAGGVGGLLAALAARSGCEVTCVVREESVLELRDRGVSVQSTTLGDFSASVNVESTLTEPVDICFFAVKHPSLAKAIDSVDVESVRTGCVVPLLNGVEHVEELRQRFPNVIAGIIRVASTRVAPGRIDHVSPFVEVDLGTTSELGPKADNVAALLQRMGITTRVVPDEVAMMWTKLALLAPISLLTTEHGASIGNVREQHEQELSALVDEVAVVAEAVAGIKTADKAWSFYKAFPADARTSMEVDLEAHRPIELDAIGGAVIRSARTHGIETPELKRLVTGLAQRTTV